MKIEWSWVASNFKLNIFIPMEMEITKKLTLHAKKSLAQAETIASGLNSPFVETEHLMLAIYLEKGSLGSQLLASLGLKKGSFNDISRNSTQGDGGKNPIKISPRLKAIIIRAYRLASQFNYPYVGTEHLFYALVQSGDVKIKKIMKQAKLNEKSINPILRMGPGSDLFPNLSRLLNLPEISLAKNHSSKNTSTPFLDQFAIDINREALEKDEEIIGRDNEIERIANILGRKNKNNPVLVGEPGVGKTAIVYGLAQKINRGEVPELLMDKKILMLDMALLVAGTSFRGEFESRLKKVVEEAEKNSRIILFIDEIHSIVGAGNVSGSLDAANILKPSLTRGKMQCIGATTVEEYKKHIEKDPALERRLQPIKISEPSPEETKKIIEGVKASFEKFHNISLSPEAIQSAVDLSVRYINDRFLPDKALDIIDEASSAIRNRNYITDYLKEIKKYETEKEKIMELKNDLVIGEKYEEAALLREKEKSLSQKIELYKKKQAEMENINPVTVTRFDIIETVSRMTGIPAEKISHEGKSESRDIEKTINSQIIGQKEAVEKLLDCVYRSQSGLGSHERPIGSFLFLGPTGVGKTLTAKIFAKEVFESAKALVRIDMSEFMERHSVSQLIGAPAGYIGYGEGGRLTEKVRRQPYSVILFDEIEKAHPDVFNILLQILEDGALTDAEGRLVNFKNTVIILTSNLGTEEFSQSSKIGFESKSAAGKIPAQFESIKNRVLANLKKTMKPELLNRLDQITVFNPLGKKEIEKIAQLELEKLRRRAAEKGICLKILPPVAGYIARKSLSASQGARLVRKNIEDLIENKIAKAIVENKIKNKKVSLGVKAGKVVIK